MDKKSGFAYNPNQFEMFDIKCLLTGWTDINNLNAISNMLGLVKEMTLYDNSKSDKVKDIYKI